MVIQSLCFSDLALRSLEVEVHLVPGSAEIRILGLPDASTRESAVRVKAALRASGFAFPGGRSVLVQLRAPAERKSSRGLDLAIAVGILRETGQLAKDTSQWTLYGELGLDGRVRTPDDFLLWPPELEAAPFVLTGVDVAGVSPSHHGVGHLREIHEPKALCPRQPQPWVRPDGGNLAATPSAARLLEVVAVGGHSALLAGPAGSGKTSTWERLLAVAPVPGEGEGDWLRRFHRSLLGVDLATRPWIAPHHSMSINGLVGGGSPPRPGEVTRAHGGFLVLDEFLEFSGPAVEALREPLQTGKVRISRGSGAAEFPAEFQFLATTNLCPCGRFVPGRLTGCVCSSQRRLAYVSRLNGPVLDRIQLLAFTDRWSREKQTVRLTEVRDRVDTVLREGPVDPEVPGVIEEMIHDEYQATSWRRRHALVAVAKTLARIKGRAQVDTECTAEALELTVRPFQALLRSLEG